MKLFIKRYILVLLEAILLYTIIIAISSIKQNYFETYFSITLGITLLFSYEIRIVDDINDYYSDQIKNKRLFNRKILFIMLVIDILAATILLSIFKKYFFIVPMLLILILLEFDNRFIKLLILPIIAFSVCFYTTGFDFLMIPIVSIMLIISIIFSLFKKPNKLILEEVGGKAFNLSRIRGCIIPKYIVIPYFDLVNSEKINIYIKSFCKKGKVYAVRSSGIDEDSSNNSFAGVHDTYLNVEYSKLLEKIELVRQSAYSEVAINYRKLNKLNDSDIKISVIIQEMVQADYAGVINTINPVTNDMNEVVISICEGLGNKLVDGNADGTTYYINGIGKKIVGKDLINKELINKLVKVSNRISKQTNHFQDIEFAIMGKKVYLLQTRDITTYKNIDSHHMSLLIDNSNIIESYYGVTSPLTYSFAKEIYSKVYTATFNVGHVRDKIMDSLKDSLENMLYYYDGKIYYNLKSWYHVTSIFPSKKSTKYMESMMGVKTSNKEYKKVKLNLIDALKILVIFLNKLKNMDTLSNEFVDHLNEIVLPYYGKEISLPNNELKKLYESIEKQIIPEFTTPILNDCAVMFYFGRLKEKAKKYSNATAIINEAVNNNGDVESAKSTIAMEEICLFIKKNHTIKQDFETLLDEELMSKYYYSENELATKLKEYVFTYGARVMNELKLETVTLIENPGMIITMIKNSLNSEINLSNRQATEIPNKLKKLSVKAKHYVQNRERLRLKRTYVFSVVRNIFLAYGKNYFTEKRIDNIEDIFYLTKEEILNDVKDVKKLIAERKENEVEYKKHLYYNRVAFYGDEVLPISSMKSATGLCGIPSGGGIVKARVSILNNPTDEFTPGNIILTKRTDPGWISLFPQAAGIIVEHGSMLSHSFVVAREMGLPAVVGVTDATSIIKNNELVTLDGIQGEIRIEN